MNNKKPETNQPIPNTERRMEMQANIDELKTDIAFFQVFYNLAFYALTSQADMMYDMVYFPKSITEIHKEVYFHKCNQTDYSDYEPRLARLKELKEMARKEYYDLLSTILSSPPFKEHRTSYELDR